MKYLAVIPARSGSKRLPNKNILTLNNKPLLQWTIDFAVSLGNIEDVILSTDSQAIIDSIEPKGILVPWLRPSYLSTDKSLTSDVCLHALDWYEKNLGGVDAVITLQPTSPFRSVETFEEARELFELNKPKSVVTVLGHSFKSNAVLYQGSGITRELREKPQFLVENVPSEEFMYPSGNLYLTNANELKAQRSLLGSYLIPLKSKFGFEDLDIDDDRDFEMARILAQYF